MLSRQVSIQLFIATSASTTVSSHSQQVYLVPADHVLYPLWELRATLKHSDTDDVLGVCLSPGSPNECLLDASAEQTEQSN